MIVHILWHGHALCGQSGVPRDWPLGHLWVAPEKQKDATCEECLKAQKEREVDHSKLVSE